MKSILNEGKSTAVDIRNELMTLEEYKNKSREALAKETRSEKELRAKERAIEDEVSQVTRKRRNDVEDTYKDQINKSKTKLKKTTTRREKTRDEKMAGRIKEETGDLISDNRMILADIKSIMYKEKIPSFCRTNLFFSLFMPKSILDLFKILIAAVIVIFLLPLLVIEISPWEEGLFLKAVAYTVIILVCGGAYIVFRNTVVEVHKELLAKIRAKKNKIDSNNKEIKSITKGIRKDKDDSSYNLGKFDKEMESINDELDDLVKEQKDALATFENTTKYMIENEIKTKYQNELIKLDNQYHQAKKDADRLQDVVNKMTLDISKKYDAYLGKEFLKVDKLNAIIEIIDKGEAKTIKAAMDVYKSKYEI